MLFWISVATFCLSRIKPNDQQLSFVKVKYFMLIFDHVLSFLKVHSNFLWRLFLFENGKIGLISVSSQIAWDHKYVLIWPPKPRWKMMNQVVTDLF